MVAALGIIGQSRSLVIWMFLAGLAALPLMILAVAVPIALIVRAVLEIARLL